MPALPRYHGQMAIGDPVAILSTATSTQKGYRVGETVGEFKLLAFDREKIKFEWHEKTVEKKLDELVAKEAPPAPAAAAVAAQQAQQNAARPSTPQAQTSGPITTVIATPGSSSNPVVNTSASNSNSTLPPAIGPDIGGGLRGCVGSDDSAPGTTLSGYRKNIIKSMFGDICRWEPVK